MYILDKGDLLLFMKLKFKKEVTLTSTFIQGNNRYSMSKSNSQHCLFLTCRGCRQCWGWWGVGSHHHYLPSAGSQAVPEPDCLPMGRVWQVGWKFLNKEKPNEAGYEGASISKFQQQNGLGWLLEGGRNGRRDKEWEREKEREKTSWDIQQLICTRHRKLSLVLCPWLLGY